MGTSERKTPSDSQEIKTMTTNDRPTLITAEQLNRTCYGMEISSGFLSPAEEGENAGKRDNDRAEAEDGNFPFGQTLSLIHI